MVKVIHIHEAPKGWEKDPDYVYIGRGNKWKGLKNSRWANPFTIRKALKFRGIESKKDMIRRYGKDLGSRIYRIHEQECRLHVINQFHHYLESNRLLMAAIPLLAGKTLVCWCKPEKCHGDVIAGMVRRYEKRHGSTVQRKFV